MTISHISGSGQLAPLSHTFGTLALSDAPASSAGSSTVLDLSTAAKPVFQALLQISSAPGKGLVSFDLAPANTPMPTLTSAPSLPPSSKPQYVLPSNPMLVARLTQTVRDIASLGIYPAPVFSFSV